MYMNQYYVVHVHTSVPLVRQDCCNENTARCVQTLSMIRYLPLLLLLLQVQLNTARNVSLAGTENRDLEIPTSGKFIHLEAESHDRAVIVSNISINHNTACHHPLLTSLRRRRETM